MKHTRFFCSMLLTFYVISASLFAVTAVDGTGRNVHLEKNPRRIVSLSPAATEIIFAVGAGNQIVARTDYCDFPAEALAISSTGGFDGKTLSLETVLSFRPDLVYASAGMHDHLIEPLQRYGVAVFVSHAITVAEVLREIRVIAQLTGHSAEGEKTAAAIEAQITAAKNTATAKKVYWEVWNSPYMSAGRNSFINDIIRVSGGINIFADAKQPYPIVSDESILARNPQVILLADDSAVSIESIQKRTGWTLIDAVKNGDIYKINANIVSRPGPRIGEAVQLLADIMKN